jgi:hypothetical protein
LEEEANKVAGQLYAGYVAAHPEAAVSILEDLGWTVIPPDDLEGEGLEASQE